MSWHGVDDITVACDDLGGGDPLVLIHGHPFNRSMWRPQRDYFSRAGWRVIVPDLRGYGDNALVPGPLRWEMFARDIGALLDRLVVERVVIGGLSMGGQIVMEFHRLFSDRVRALVLADTTARAESQAGRRQRHDQADRLRREGMDPYAREVLPKMVGPDSPPGVTRHVLTMMRATAPAGAAAALRARADRPDYVEFLRRVAVPTLIVVGDDDPLTPIGDARLMHERIPDARLVVIKRARHIPNLERPAEFNQALKTFLDSIERPERSRPAAASNRSSADPRRDATPPTPGPPCTTE